MSSLLDGRRFYEGTLMPCRAVLASNLQKTAVGFSLPLQLRPFLLSTDVRQTERAAPQVHQLKTILSITIMTLT